MTDITAEQLATILKPVWDGNMIGSVELWQDLHGEWVGNFAGTDAADLAAMHIIRKLNAEGWDVDFCDGNNVTFWGGESTHTENYTHHPIEALARFAASRKGTA